jgi:medium-chain acyl-[acyl-carrier-protein] hydrolase
MSQSNTSGVTPSTPWLTVPKLNPKATLRLFCFPYAGGGPLIYRNWPDNLPDFVEVCPVQLPGRGQRIREPGITQFEILIPKLAEALVPAFDKPFAFFGHSLGATIAFELSRYLRREHGIQPVHLFASGSPAPQLPDRHPRTFDQPESEFIESVRRLKGTPQEVLDNPELMQLIIPLLRADFQLAQTYVYTDDLPLDCPLSAFGGLQDIDIPREDIESWREQTTAAFTIRMLPGDHFFLLTEQRRILQLVFDTLSRLARRGL